MRLKKRKLPLSGSIAETLGYYVAPTFEVEWPLKWITDADFEKPMERVVHDKDKCSCKDKTMGFGE